MENINKLEGNPEKQKRWDERYLKLADHIRQWSKDPNAKVGAAVVNPKIGRVVSLGFNGFPSNVEDTADRLNDSDLKLQTVIHAEQNAIIYAGREARECDVYVIGKPVCNTCAILLIQAGIKRVIAAKPKMGTESKWDKAGLYAIKMLEEAGVQFAAVSEDQLRQLGLNEADATSSEPPVGMTANEGE